jgi:hypothetical protein
MSLKTFSRVAATIFAVFALLHAYRLVAPFPVVIGSFDVPQVASWGVVFVVGTLSVLGFRARS